MKRVYLYLAALIIAACAEPIEEYDYLESENPLSISVTDDSQSRGEMVNYVEDMISVGVFCALTGEEYWSAEETEFDKLYDRRFTLSDDGEWVMDGIAVSWGYESVSDKYSAFAYSPHVDDAQWVEAEIIDGEMVIEYSVPKNSIKQPDLMIATPQKNIYPQTTGGIPLSFQHVLSCISFSVISKTTSKITGITVSGAVSAGTLTWDYTYNVPKWSPNNSVTKDFSVKVEDEYTLDSENKIQINTNDGYLMMIPQTLTEGATITLSINDDEQTEVLTIPKGSEWVMGGVYDYVITLEEEGCFIFNSEQLSNCYMIHPVEGVDSFIQIPIEDRINDFWVNHAGDSEQINADSNFDNFSIEQIWEDFDGVVDCFGKEFVIDSEGKVAVQITLDAKFQVGNFVFSVNDKNDDPLWTWHLWFTDYDPDTIAAQNVGNIIAGKDMEYEYGDYEGAVHRYIDDPSLKGDDAVWAGIYANKFIMDRNIGERNCYAENAGSGAVYYQFGRKEPLPGNGGEEKEDELSVNAQSLGSADFDEAFIFPERLVRASSSPYNWCGETIARANNRIWYDYRYYAATYTEGKSIFDPSPLGWRVPVINTWSNFKNTIGCDGDPSFGIYNKYGYRDASNNAALTDVDCGSYVWSANQPSIAGYAYGYCFYCSDDEVNVEDESYLSSALPVRAIQE